MADKWIAAQDCSLVQDMLSLHKSPWCDACTQSANVEDLVSLEVAGRSAGDEDTAECPGCGVGN
jgi:hypothetical protein